MRRGLAAGTLALGDFVLVVGELQVCAATMDIKGFTQSGAAHGRALNMPTGAAWAEVMSKRGAVPHRVGRLTGFSGLPQSKVKRVMLVRLHRNPLTGTQFIQRFTGKLPVTGKLAHRKIHIPIVGPVRQTPLTQGADDLQHLGHVIGGARLKGRRFDA